MLVGLSWLGIAEERGATKEKVHPYKNAEVRSKTKPIRFFIREDYRGYARKVNQRLTSILSPL